MRCFLFGVLFCFLVTPALAEEDGAPSTPGKKYSSFFPVYFIDLSNGVIDLDKLFEGIERSAVECGVETRLTGRAPQSGAFVVVMVSGKQFTNAATNSIHYKAIIVVSIALTTQGVSFGELIPTIELVEGPILPAKAKIMEIVEEKVRIRFCLLVSAREKLAA